MYEKAFFFFKGYAESLINRRTSVQLKQKSSYLLVQKTRLPQEIPEGSETV